MCYLKKNPLNANDARGIDVNKYQSGSVFSKLYQTQINLVCKAKACIFSHCS